MTPRVRPYASGDHEQVDAIRREAFGGGVDDAMWSRGGWVLEERGQIHAALLVERAGQFFGGKVVSSALVRSVAVASDRRGRGAGGTLLAGVLAELRSEGLAFSALYPTSLSLYRRAGYETAGSQTRYRQPIRDLPRKSATSVGPMTSVPLDEIRACYRTLALASSGLLDRPQSWWERELEALREGRTFGVVARSHGEISGYLLYAKQPVNPSEAEPQNLMGAYGLLHSVQCRDLVWNDADAALSLLAHAAGAGSLGTDLYWSGPPLDPLQIFAGAQGDVSVAWTSIWMARPLDLVACLEGRGYPSTVTATVDLEVVDPILQENSGAFRLAIEGGQAEVQRIQSAPTRIDVGALASLYTGWLSARDAVRLGRITGANEADVTTLHAVFAGPPPWLMDTF